MRSIEELIQRQVNRWNSITETLKYVPGRKEAGTVAPVEPGSVKHPPICISRELGSGAREICHYLCQHLGYEIFGRSIIDEIAKDMHVQRQLIDSLDEHGRSELELIIESYLRGREIESQEYLGSLVRVIKTLGRGGGVVLLGRGGAFILREQSALNVLVIAPLELRVKRLMAYNHLNEKDARKEVLAYEHAREYFVRKFFGEDIHNTGNFDLVINTGRIPPEQAGEVVLQALKTRGYSLEEMAMPVSARASCSS
jgi:cytidylate kinase